MGKMLKICRGCGKTFTTTKSAQVYCSDECKNEHIHQTLICKNCGKEFVQQTWAQSFCSPECRCEYNNEKAHQKALEKKAKENLETVCAVCGKTFIAKRKDTKYCSKECLRIQKRNKAREWHYDNQGDGTRKVYHRKKPPVVPQPKEVEHSIKDVEEVMEKYRCSYGKAVILMGW